MLEKTIDITTKAGPMETFICHPESNGPFPAIFFLMDAYGVREELKDITRQLGTVGYYVLLPNLYYRAGRDTIYGADVQKEGSAEHHAGRQRREMVVALTSRGIAAAETSLPGVSEQRRIGPFPTVCGAHARSGEKQEEAFQEDRRPHRDDRETSP